MQEVYRVQEDQNHIVKRIWDHTRRGFIPDVDFKKFHAAMVDEDTDLTEAVLKGDKKQSVGDTEKLLSHAVADHLIKKGSPHEEEFVRTAALWHEASDGRGMTQTECNKASMRMPN